jgi:hypothetical protein
MRSGKEEGLLRPDRGVCRIIPALLFLAAICILPWRAACVNGTPSLGTPASPAQPMRQLAYEC